MPSKIVMLDQKGDSAEIYCPVCGQPVFENEGTSALCSHVLFTYVDLAGEFGYVNQELQELAEGARGYSDVWGVCPVEVLMLSIDRPDAFCLAVTTSGLACGPMSATAYVGFKFTPEPE